MVFSHSSGIHLHGVLKDRNTYEIMTPESVGWLGKATKLSSHIGRNGLADYLNKLGYDGAAMTGEIYLKFLEFADKKESVTDEDLHMLVQEYRLKEEANRENLFMLSDEDISFSSGVGLVCVRRGKESRKRVAKSDKGTLDALFHAVRKAIEAHGEDVSRVELIDYSVIKGEGGPEAIAWVAVRVRLGNCLGCARSGDSDTVKASVKAYLYAINHMLNAPISV